MKQKIVKAKDIKFGARKRGRSGIVDTLASMKPGDAIENKRGGYMGMISLVNRVCPDRTWNQRKATDGKTYIVCEAKK
jgi:hypothetical protein